jgi:hypothetical protein
VVFDRYNDVMSIRLDGRETDIGTGLGSFDSSNDVGFHIGHPSSAMAAGVAGLDGIVDELQFFVRALSWCEIGMIHVAGDDGICRDDRDSDGVIDYEDNCQDLANTGQQDIDHDRAGDVCDCQWMTYTVHHAPGDTGGLRVGVDLARDRLGWCSRKEDCGSETAYTLVRGRISELPVGSGSSETCLASAIGLTRIDDPAEPEAGDGFWYVLRAHNGCGVGAYGYGAGGERMPAPSCPLTERELCGDTGGDWREDSCGHYICGVEPDCDAIIPGCDCGPGRNFQHGTGCMHDPGCQ